MPREFPRSRRVEEQVQRILSDVIRAEARDPRLRNAIVTAVKVSRDLGVAWVYVTSLDPDHRPADLEDAFAGAAGFLRSAVASELTVRHAPELRFRYDDTLSRAARMDELIDTAVAADRQEPGPRADDDTADD